MLSCFVDKEKRLTVLGLGAMGGKAVRAGEACGALQ